ncbi:acetate kinase [Colletotrichum kahawae]|uniref:Acetate kinase n=1 Tax=Colletotrichum kahawae TaxID=34407 RepID=A0AAE0CY53_COLKA|nr:acetate kinase [Colletotrichum kahawae]
MAASSSGSSFTSSSLGRPPSYAQPYASPLDSTWTPTSGASTISALTSEASAPHASLRPLDLGPPGYQATMLGSLSPALSDTAQTTRTLFENTPNERTVYLGPWEVVGSEQRRVLWQCSYQSELLEHFLPSDVPADVFPHTLHSRHRPYTDPCELELYVSFREPHRVRYTTGEGMVMHDHLMEVKYEFTTVESSLRFQGDIRRKDLVDYYDIDVVWSDVHGRTDGFGNIRGMGLVQRLKLWRDRYSTYHSLTVFANRAGGCQHREYEIHNFEGEVRNRDDRHRQVRLTVRGSRRSSAPDSGSSRSRFAFSHRMRPRVRSGSQGGGPNSEASSSPGTLDMRYLGIQFSKREDYRRFLEKWVVAHSSDSEFHGIPFPPHHVELPSPQILPEEMSELPSPDIGSGLQPVVEPPDSYDSDSTP